MLELIALAATSTAGVVGYWKSRDFVHTRLRYVDRVQKAGTPLIAGAVAAVVALPVVAVVPLIGAGTAMVFGAAVGLGTRAGAYRIRRGVISEG
jgi:hypothetical protein